MQNLQSLKSNLIEERKRMKTLDTKASSGGPNQEETSIIYQI